VTVCVRSRAAIAVVLTIAGLLTTACGYSLAGRGSFLPDHIRRIGVPTFTNRTPVFNLETQITQKVRSELLGRGGYEVLPEAPGADAVIEGEVTTVRPEVAAVSAQNLASRYTVTMTARVALRDTRDNKVLWENQNMVFRQEYEAQSGTSVIDPAAFFEQDVNALERMTTEFSRALVSAILEAF
jgi:hypothetical protein